MKAELRDLLLIRKYFHDHVFARVAVTDQEIEVFLEKNPSKNVAPEQVRARQIIVKTEEEARIVLAELKGARCRSKTRRSSIRSVPRQKMAGISGFSPMARCPRSSRTRASPMSVGQTSGIVPSDYGFHIFKVDRASSGGPASHRKGTR